MNILNIYSTNPYREDATIQQIAKHIYNNFDKALKIIVGVAKDNKCIICADFSLNYKSPASLMNHLQWVHRKKTMEYTRDVIMQKSVNEIEEMLNDECDQE